MGFSWLKILIINNTKSSPRLLSRQFTVHIQESIHLDDPLF